MSEFLDGPAKGVRLLIRRAPIFLRVVRGGPDGQWDALDQVHDRARDDEEIHAYILTETPASCHLQRIVDGRRTGGFYQMGKYMLCDPQPTNETMRDNEEWSAWCHAQPVPDWVSATKASYKDRAGR